jgi:hypothetical protein
MRRYILERRGLERHGKLIELINDKRTDVEGLPREMFLVFESQKDSL